MKRDARGPVGWVAMGLVLVVSLAIGSRGDTTTSEADDVRRVARTVRCPTCEGLSVAESDAKASGAVRDEIRRRVRAGESDGEIRLALAQRYGNDILLTPPSSGIGALVWALPVAALLIGTALLTSAFRRWARGP